MPRGRGFASEAQRKLFYAKERRGELSKATVARWEKETGGRKLPKRKGNPRKAPAMRLATKADVRNAATRIRRGKSNWMYTAAELAAVKKRIRAAGKRLGVRVSI